MQYTFSLSRRSLPVRCLCLLLIVVVLLCFFLTPRASAVALEAATVAYAGALVGAILVGAGVAFASHGDMQQVGAAMYKSWVKSSNAIGTKIGALASWALEHGEAVAKGALRVGKDLYQGIIDAFNATYSDGKITLGSDIFPLSADASEDEISAFCNLFANKDITSFYFAEHLGTSRERIHHAYYTVSDGVYCMVIDNAYGGGSTDLYERKMNFGSTPVQSVYFTLERGTGSFLYVTLNVFAAKYSSYVQWAASLNDELSVSLSPISVSVPQPDLKYPSDDYLVKMPDLPAVDGVTGDVTYPSDAAYTKDAIAVPYPVDADGVKVLDIPYDKVVDQSTGKALDDTGTDTDNPSKPGEGTDTGADSSSLIGQIIALLKNFFDSPSDFKLDFDGFKNLILPERFPFCIPFDMVKAVKLFAADAADFVFSIDLDTQYFSIHHTVDLTPYTLPIVFFRYGCVIWFVWILISRTHDLIKW